MKLKDVMEIMKKTEVISVGWKEKYGIGCISGKMEAFKDGKGMDELKGQEIDNITVVNGTMRIVLR